MKVSRVVKVDTCFEDGMRAYAKITSKRRHQDMEGPAPDRWQKPLDVVLALMEAKRTPGSR